MNKITIEDALIKVVRKLVGEEYNSLVINDVSKRLTPEEIKLAIDEYPGTLTMPDNINNINKYEYDISDEEVLVELELWYDGAPSDLTLSLTIFNDGSYSIENIHVL